MKSYLPTHDTFHQIACYTLCIFADASRTECAEAKKTLGADEIECRRCKPHGMRRGKGSRPCQNGRESVDASRTECAEAKCADSALSPPLRDASRTECAEAKKMQRISANEGVDASRTECAEAKCGVVRYRL